MMEPKPRKLTAQEAIWILLYSQPYRPLYDFCCLCNQLYLLREHLDYINADDWKFVKNKGMQSEWLNTVIWNLLFLNQVWRSGTKWSQGEKWILAPLGAVHAKEVWDIFSPQLQHDLQEFRIGHDQLPREAIVRLTSNKFFSQEKK